MADCGFFYLHYCQFYVIIIGSKGGIMARTFIPYIPKVLKLTEEQKNKVPKGEKIRFGINRVKQKNGDIYVTERAYYIVPETNKPRAIASVKIGTIPKGQTEMIADGRSKSAPKHRTVEQIANKAQEVLGDERQQGKVRFPLDLFWTVCFLSALTGRTDAASIADYWNTHRKTIFKGYDNVSDQDISADTVLRLMSLLTTEQALQMAQWFARQTKAAADDEQPNVVAIDGQSVRASRVNDGRCGHFLNLFHCNSRQFMGQCLIESKENEVTRTPELLAPFDLDGTIVTADALFAKASMFEAIVNKGADYCIPVKDNAKLFKRDIDDAFTRVLNESQSDEAAANQIKHVGFEIELGHGRIEEREIDVLPGKLLSKKHRDHWIGLEDGCIVQYMTRTTDKKTGKQTTELKHVVSSVRWDSDNVAEVLGTVLRRHWEIENQLHWKLDVAFRQDRIQCKNGKYLSARTWLNKIALNLLQNFKNAENSTKSLERLMVQMHDPKVALKCLRLNLA